MKAIEIIEQSLSEAKQKGLRITCGGCLFDWTGDNYSLKGCNCLGAVMLKFGLEHLAGPSGGFAEDWLIQLSAVLGEPPFWMARFLLGFDIGTQVVRITINKEGKEINREEDEVSRMGLKLRKKFV